jgi:uncharacterized membrane protein
MHQEGESIVSISAASSTGRSGNGRAIIPCVIDLLLVLLTAGWVALLIVGPLLPAWTGALVYGFASLICHQIPERSFHLAGFQLPVCARCTGIYAGAAGGAAYAWMRWIQRRHAHSRAPRVSRRVAVLAASPTLLTVALESAGLWSPSNLTRALAGMPLGIIAGLVVIDALATLHYDECAPPRPTVPRPPQRSI